MTGFFTAPGNEGNAYRREVIANLAGDAMRQMNPFRGSSPQPSNTGSTQQQPATLNIPGDNWQPAATNASTQALKQSATSPAATALAGSPPSTAPPKQSLKEKQPLPSRQAVVNLAGNVPQQPAGRPNPPLLRTTLAGGMTYEGDNQGNRTYTMGTPGQDGYGHVSVRPGSVPQADQQTLQVGGLTVTGNSDAVNRLAAPVGTYDRNSPEYNQAQAQNYQKANPFSRNNPYDDRFSYKPPVEVDQDFIARQRLIGDLAYNDARIAGERINQQKGQMEIDQAKKIQALNDQYLAEKDPAKQRALGNQLLTMQGKVSKDWQITTREEPLDPANPMMGTTKRPYAVNLNDPNKIIELGGQGGGGRYEEAPLESGSRKKGSVYNTPKGPLKWTGTGWTDEF